MMYCLQLLSLIVFVLMFTACGKNASLVSQSNENDVAVELDAEALLKLGEQSYLRCRACHTLGLNEPHTIGPNLHGVFNAKAGVKKDFKYSDALVKSNIVWTDDNLREWLSSPAAMVPGKKMAFVGVFNETELDALIVHLNERTQ